MFLVGPLCLVVSLAARSDSPFLAFLGLASVYGYYHVVRQHYGFIALYRAKSKEPVTRTSYGIDKGALYLGMWLPWVFFLVAHPIGRALRGSSGAVTTVESAAGTALFVTWLVVLAAYAARWLRTRTGGLKAPYLLIVTGVHGLLYFVAARFEPVYSLAKNADQQLLLMTVMGGMLHSAQYIGIVWLYNAAQRRAFPDARQVSRRVRRVLGALLRARGAHRGVSGVRVARRCEGLRRRPGEPPRALHLLGHRPPPLRGRSVHLAHQTRPGRRRAGDYLAAALATSPAVRPRAQIRRLSIIPSKVSFVDVLSSPMPMKSDVVPRTFATLVSIFPSK